MRKINIDEYEIYCKNGDLKKIKFKNYLGEEICIDIENTLKIELLQRRKEEYSEDYKRRRYIDRYLNDDCLIEIKTANITEDPEQIIINRDKRRKIIQEIWSLPNPQNRRVYMRLISDFKLKEIAKIENCSIEAIRLSLNVGMKNLRKKLKNFSF